MCCSHFTGNLDPTPLYHKYRQTSKSYPHTQSVDLPRSLFDAHSPRQPSASPASPAFSAPESYFTMHASYLIICPRFTLGVAAVTEKNGGQTEGHTHTHTHTHTHVRTHTHTTAITLRCACAQARVNYVVHYEYIPPKCVLRLGLQDSTKFCSELYHWRIMRDLTCVSHTYRHSDQDMSCNNVQSPVDIYQQSGVLCGLSMILGSS